MEDQSITLGGVIRGLRTVRGVSQSGLAELVNVDSTYVSHLERGTREPSLRILRQLAEALKVPATMLFAVAVWDELTDEERKGHEGFVRSLVRSTALMNKLGR